MAADGGRKLMPYEKVEVRSLEDGFLGSWHTGTIIGSGDLTRTVRYDHLLNDEGSERLTEKVKVIPAIDGITDEVPYNHRGMIRPLPSSSGTSPWHVHYGQCVDLFHKDAWWEGVIFDNEDGCNKRRIFFPDLGDEMEGGIEMLRVSLDWNEITEEWKPRGNWLFLELIEEVERVWPLPVSVKQMWYEVRTRNGFEKLREWTSSGRGIWRELVLQVWFDNLRINAKHLFLDLRSSWDEAKLGQPLPEFSDKDFYAVIERLHTSRAVVQIDVNGNHQVQERNDQAPISVPNLAICPLNLDEDSTTVSNNYDGARGARSISTKKRDYEWMPAVVRIDVNGNHQVQERNDKAPISVPNLAICPLNLDEDSATVSNNYDGAHVACTISTKKRGFEWMPAVPELVPGPEYFPNIIDECNKYHKMGRTPPDHMRMKASKHLIHLGWKIEFVRDGKIIRRRYFTPGGQLYTSLRLACLSFDHDFQLESESQILMRPNYGGETPTSLSNGTLSPPNSEKFQASSELSKSCSVEKGVLEPGYCPKAVMEYYELSLLESFRGGSSKEAKLKAEKAKRDLTFIGWQIYYHHLKSPKRELRYKSPIGKVYCSLATACKSCVEDGSITSDCRSPDMVRLENVNLIKDFDDHLSMNNSHLPLITIENDKFDNLQSFDAPMSNGIVQSISGEASKTKMRRKRSGPSLSSNERKKSRTSMRGRGDMNGVDSSILVRRSSKRVRDRIASSSQQTPRTVLSWLIDNNVVLPREKVQYRCRKDGLSKAEGRVAREGIKCGCCGIIFSLSNFEEHAGSSSPRPSAHIFLEGGRSLLDCQLQLRQQMNKKYSRSEHEKKGRRHNVTNDYICSVCHYGGELLLCDNCPSSFHTECLGLKEVPEGDWFCLSCCCKICSKNRSDEGNGQITDSSYLSCGQCEQRYHVECLRNKGISDTNYNSEGYWFCQESCEQIFCGLREIMGKKFPVGNEDLSWSLVKCMETDSLNPETSDDEAFVESYSKLNVALCVMHECFEPVKEPSTKRDLVEDIIFNRGSELNRLNFRGFYTILLEKKDELISAATLRIYGKKVAEIPLVATRFQYRRLGMCRILMNELEKKLMDLGVERLVLPAIPTVLNTWKYSFGFSEMDKSEQLNFLNYTFLNFQGTIFCQKVLEKSSLQPNLSLAVENGNSCNTANNKAIIGLDGSSSVSEVFEEKKVHQTDIVEQESTCIKTAADNENGSCTAQTAIVMYEPAVVKDSSFARLEDSSLKCYKRRKTLTC